MDVLTDASSPRRGSINSLHRQSSGSLSHSSKLTSQSSGLQSTSNNKGNFYKEVDKFTRHFIIKTVQVIVQSRISGVSVSKTECKPNGSDWFSINITDISEVSDRTKEALDFEGFSIRSNWRVCCEISLQTNDGGRVVLEHWIISNKTNLNSSQNNLQSKLISSSSNNQTSPKAVNRSSHLSTSNNGIGPLSVINSTSTVRVCPTPFSGRMRTRLNSIDDCSGDDAISDKILIGTNNENFDIKSSTSCYSLSNLSANQMTDQTQTITPSPSSNSMSNNNTVRAQPSNSAHNSKLQGYKTNSMSSIYTIYNSMSLLLKTLMTTTHIIPAYKLASSASSQDSCVICYRVHAACSSPQNPKPNPAAIKDSPEESSHSPNTEPPNRRLSSSNSSCGSVNIRDLVGPEELDHFCPIIKLGSIKTEVNELEVLLCYRTDLQNSSHLSRLPISRDKYNRLLDEDCITAAKQLLKGNEHLNIENHHRLSQHNCDDICDGSRERDKNEVLNYIDQPLRPAFANKDQNLDINGQDPELSPVEIAFDGLLKIKSPPMEDHIDIIPDLVSKPLKTPNSINGCSASAQSEPIQVPTGSHRPKLGDLYPNLSPGSTPKSLTESFVFVELNPPFASEEQNDINSFFHGPSPTFYSGFDTLKDVDELTSQLAVIEANASQLDEFVDNICMSEEEEEEEET